MTSGLSADLDRFLDAGQQGVVQVPVLVKGRLEFPPAGLTAKKLAALSAPGEPQQRTSAALQSFVTEGARIIRQPIYDRTTLAPTGEFQILALAQPEPAELIEHDPSGLARGLYALPIDEVLQYIEALRDVLQSNRALLERAAATVNAASFLDGAMFNAVFHSIPEILDAKGLGAAVDSELGWQGYPGRDYLNGWVVPDTRSQRGMMARMSDQWRTEAATTSPNYQHAVRAMPTRQLHITAGNSPLVPLISLVRAIATKGAAVIKSPAEVTIMSALFAMAMRAVDPNHPITRHMSLVYWKGGDPHFEDVLFRNGAFDRIVVWGSPDTVTSVRQKALDTKTIYLNPRYGLSLIGREAFAENLSEVARRACTDSMIANQKACTSSLVHYIEASEDQALAYCAALQEQLREWDAALPQLLPRAVLGQLRLLRRTEMVGGKWFVNGNAPQITSAVVYMPHPFDLSRHPASRLIVVRRIDHPDDMLPFVNASVSTVGVFPDTLLQAQRDVLIASGTSNVMRLGECERIYAGMPHDGMRVLSELVNWVNG